MSRHRDIDQIFKDGLKDYKAGSDSSLEKKMAAMIGISSIGGGGAGGGATGGTAAGGSGTVAGGGSSVGGSVGSSGSVLGSGSSAITGGVASSGTGIAGSTGMGVVSTTAGTIGKLSLFTKSSGIIGGFVKAVGVKIGLVAKSLGVVKTIGAIAVVGGTSAVVVHQVERNSDTDYMRKKSVTVIPSHQNNFLLNRTLQLEPSDWLYMDEDSAEKIRSKKYNDYLIFDKEDLIEDTIREEDYNLLVSNDKYVSNLDYSNNAESFENQNEVVEDQIPENILPKSMFLDLQWKYPDLGKDSLKLNTDVPQPKSMSTLEKGFYLPNYDITAGAVITPMMAWQLYENELDNDSIPSHSFNYSAQLSWSFGAEFRIQKKRGPLFAQIGINYQNLNIKSDYHFDHYTYWNTDTINYEIIVNPPNIDTLLNIDSTFYSYNNRVGSSGSSVDQYHSLEIPVKIGYQYRNYTKAWSLEVAVGISPSVLIHASGNTYQWSAEIVDFSTQDMNPKWNLFAIGHIGFNYQYRNAIFFMRPSFKYQLTQSGYLHSPEKNQFFILGTQLGVRFKLFKNAGQP